MPYTPEKPPLPETADQLRARIPGWGVDLDPALRPSSRKQLPPQPAAGVHWDAPERQPEHRPRERSIEHGQLPAVFGTTLPLRGASGAIRRYAYRRFSEGRAAHWLLLLLGDRVDAWESHLRSFATLRPDNPLTQTGIRSEFTHHGLASRLGQRRADRTHHWLDPLLVAGPWVAVGAAAVAGGRALTRSRRGRRG